MRSVGIVPHSEREIALDLARRTAAWFEERDVEVRLPDMEAGAARLERCSASGTAFAEGLDLVIAIGGDGTMLHAVELAYPEDVPLLGVNVGQMGYLTSIEPEDVEAALPRLLSGSYSVSDRTVLELSVESDEGTVGSWFALNEAVLEKVHAGHLVRLDVSIDSSYFTTYAADGVIVATATGSTAYSFSARGPIVSPNLRCLILTPVSPHMLFDRALVLAPEEALRLVVGGSRTVALTVDGREITELRPGDTVRCAVAARAARMVSLAPRDFHKILKAKFALPDR